MLRGAAHRGRLRFLALILFLERKSIKKRFNTISNPLQILDFFPVTVLRFLVSAWNRREKPCGN
jgi:hypothetical protein